jgi:cellulose synthase/poly-beta-1,6-N-acetylglucosamine synthase-like glycosyltransferase
VVLVDADCHLGENALNLLATQALLTQKPVQGRYLMQSPAQPSIKDLISSFAFLVKNWVRPLGLSNLGFPCLLTGAGMAFPWSVLANAPLDSGNIVEDMQLGLDLAIAGYPTQFCPEATILSRLPQASDSATKQRTRWEHGHLKTLLEQCPRLLQAAWQQRRLDLAILAAELSIPPLSLLVLLWLGMGSLVLLLSIVQGTTLLPLLLLFLAGLFLILSIVIAWAGFARSWLPLTTLLLTPLYLLWKIPLYFAFLLRPQSEWVRTARDKNPKPTDS